MTGQWIAPAAEEHRCRLPSRWPLGWGSRVGDRWKCTDRLDNGERCSKVWRVGVDPYSRTREWTLENPDQPEAWKVFRPVSTEQLNYWLEQELGAASKTKTATDVVAAILKHFEVGSRQ
jgi:hypothetical protein